MGLGAGNSSLEKPVCLFSFFPDFPYGTMILPLGWKEVQVKSGMPEGAAFNPPAMAVAPRWPPKGLGVMSWFRM